MAAKRMSLSKTCFFVLSGGLANPLGKPLALEMCRNFQANSLAVLIDTNEQLLHELKKDMEYLNKNVQVVTCHIDSWEQVQLKYFAAALSAALGKADGTARFQLAIIAHNEGTLATRDLLEPSAENGAWESYVHEHLYAPVALNQAFLQHAALHTTEKLVLNITSSCMLLPMFYSGVYGSCKRARDMYFRAMAEEELRRDNVAVLSYAPGLLATHLPQTDANNNTIDLPDLVKNEKLLQLPRVQPLQSILKLINILQELSFISGHDVDCYDSYVL